MAAGIGGCLHERARAVPTVNGDSSRDQTSRGAEPWRLAQRIPPPEAVRHASATSAGARDGPPRGGGAWWAPRSLALDCAEPGILVRWVPREPVGMGQIASGRVSTCGAGLCIRPTALLACSLAWASRDTHPACRRHDSGGRSRDGSRAGALRQAQDAVSPVEPRSGSSPGEGLPGGTLRARTTAPRASTAVFRLRASRYGGLRRPSLRRRGSARAGSVMAPIFVAKLEWFEKSASVTIFTSSRPSVR